jgi:hypothetical protein
MVVLVVEQDGQVTEIILKQVAGVLAVTVLQVVYQMIILICMVDLAAAEGLEEMETLAEAEAATLVVGLVTDILVFLVLVVILGAVAVAVALMHHHPHRT